MKVTVEKVEAGSPGESTTMTVHVENDNGELSATLYVLGDGNLHYDSWIKCK